MREHTASAIPANAGIQCPNWFAIFWIPAFAGMTNFVVSIMLVDQ